MVIHIFIINDEENFSNLYNPYWQKNSDVCHPIQTKLSFFRFR